MKNKDLKNKGPNKKEFDFFDKPGNRIMLAVVYIVTLVALIISDFFIPKHPYFSVEGIPVFYAVYGFVGCVLLVVIAKQMRLFLRREEDYYD